MEIPAWLESLIETAANCSESHAPPFKMGYRYTEDGEFWEVLVYPVPVQLVGGAEDGAIVSPGFSMDLRQIASAFDKVVAQQWSVYHHLDGPEVLIEGVYQGHEVILRMLAQAPEDEEPGMVLDVGETPAAIDVN